MKRLVYYTVTLITLFTYFALTQDYDTSELLLFTALFTLLAWYLLELVLVIVLSKKYADRTKYKIFLEDSLTQCKADLLKEQQAHLDTQTALEAEELLHYETKQRLDIVLKQDSATIKLGDEVTPVSRFRKCKVYATRLGIEGKDGNGRNILVKEYQLAKGGKWFKVNEIRKVEK